MARPKTTREMVVARLALRAADVPMGKVLFSVFADRRERVLDGRGSGTVSKTQKLLFRFRFFEELDEVGLPEGGQGVGAVAAGFVGDGEEDELCVWHVVDQLFGDA